MEFSTKTAFFGEKATARSGKFHHLGRTPSSDVVAHVGKGRE
jgi:hypothetical protein